MQAVLPPDHDYAHDTSVLKGQTANGVRLSSPRLDRGGLLDMGQHGAGQSAFRFCEPLDDLEVVARRQANESSKRVYLAEAICKFPRMALEFIRIVLRIGDNN